MLAIIKIQINSLVYLQYYYKQIQILLLNLQINLLFSLLPILLVLHNIFHNDQQIYHYHNKYFHDFSPSYVFFYHNHIYDDVHNHSDDHDQNN